ncbi:MAG: Rqc2 family fibronectin-binding protein, partial [Fusobacteriaceae bacterium]
MLYLDGISLNKIKEELGRELVGKKIGKITQETELSVSIFFGRLNLVVSAAASLPICYLSEDKNLKLDENFNFLLSLKKYLQNSSLEEITQIGFDRILCFKFKKLDFLGAVNFYHLYFEIMGKHSNLILTDEKGRILDLMKRFSLEENKARLLFPGAQYELPNLEKKKNPSEISENEFQGIKENPKEFIATVEGVGKLLVQNAKDYKSFKEILESEIYPCCYLKDNRIVLATLLKGIEPKEFKEKIEFQSYSEMVNYYIEKNHMTNSQEKLFHQISNTVKKRMKKLERTLLNIEQDNLQKSDYEINREIGDILAANIYQLKKNMPQVTLYNFYRNSNMEIELNTAHTIQKNIDSYYKKYNKLKRGLVSNERRIVEVRSEIEYLESTLALATAIQTPENLKNIQTELENQGYLKVVKKGNPKGKKKVRTDNFAVYEEGENYKIIYGRNNSENDFVTFKLGDKDDFWFHAKDIPGSHVILKVNRGYLSDELIEKAARVALIYSKSEIGHRVTVEYTQRKFVSKPKGARPGAVIYTNHRE